jgi:hypothetical protein
MNIPRYSSDVNDLCIRRGMLKEILLGRSVVWQGGGDLFVGGEGGYDRLNTLRGVNFLE